MKLDQSYYFGCHEDKGHFLWDVNMMKSYYDKNRQWLEYSDGRFCPQNIATIGKAALHHLFGHITVLAFWDNSVDTRGQSNSQFFLLGIFNFDEAMIEAKRLFPKVFDRFKFEITEWRTK